MISRRNFMSIILMMAVIFIMFQFSQIIMDVGNQYDLNEFVIEKDKLPTRKGTDSQEGTSNLTGNSTGVGYILFFTEGESELKNIVSQWCTYTKRDLVVASNLRDYEMSKVLPEMILLDAANIELGVKSSWVATITEYEVPLVFCNLPPADSVKASNSLREILGIKEVLAVETQIEGVRMFEGFFLGGEALYQVQTQEDEKRQDLDLTIPWYVMGSGTKTYMVGMKDEEIVKRENFPGIIWRNSYGKTKVFAVCGDYMSTLVGLGILDSFVYELHEYTLYPVVNAQNVLIANFPGFSAENYEELMRIYSRTPQMTFRDIMWPSISAMAKTVDLKLTCLFNPQYDYTDGMEPQTDEVTFYLQQLKQLGSEAGLSLKYKENVTFDEMLALDEAFYESLNSRYQYQTLYVEQEDLSKVEGALSTSDLLKDVRSVSGDFANDVPLISYLTNNVTLQNTTGSAQEHTFLDNMTLRSIQTALCYSNVLLDLQDAVWPQKVADQWQHLYDDMSSNVQTYWGGDSFFTKTTLSESDLRVRNFLNLTYEDRRTKDTIVLQVKDYGEEAWFVLRTHAEKIVAIRGGEYTKLEDNAYLIRVLDSTVEIELKDMSLQEQGAKTW